MSGRARSWGRGTRSDVFAQGAVAPDGSACAYTHQVYTALVIRLVVLSKQAEKDLTTVPAHVALKLQDWVEDVEERGIEAVRKIPGYHDEPLKGALKGQRSIRLSKGYRAYYRVVRDAVESLRVEGVDKHVY